MCRLFGFKSSIPSQVHRSLVRAENALAVQSEAHPDGWGVAYYINNIPHLLRNACSALEDSLFRQVSGIVSSKTVIAHVRKASVGDINVLNCHPFQYGPWVFAHNGEVRSWDRVVNTLADKVAPKYRRFILGGTDSEVCFYLFLTHLHQCTEVTHWALHYQDAISALQSMISDVREVSDDIGDPSLLSFLLTNGSLLLACQGGEDLHYSTYKRKCIERDTCPAFSPECENPPDGGINHVLIASEAISEEDIWVNMKPGEGICIDMQMRMHHFAVDAGRLGLTCK